MGTCRAFLSPFCLVVPPFFSGGFSKIINFDNFAKAYVVGIYLIIGVLGAAWLIFTA